MTELKTQINFFSSPDLNKVGAELIDLYKSSAQHIQQAKEHFESATHRRWKCGKLVAKNIDIIESETTQREFAELLGITESMVSNDKRAFQALQEQGANTWDEAKKVLRDKGIKKTTRLWEKLPKLLNDPKNELEKDRRAKDERRVEELHQELEEIQQRNINSNHNLAEEAKQVKVHSEHLFNHLKQQEPINIEWESEKYVEFIRTFGEDVLTGQSTSPDERLQPHHVNPYTGNPSGGVGNKLADVWTIPTTSKTHSLAHTKDSPFSIDDYKKALLKVMATFIISNYG